MKYTDNQKYDIAGAFKLLQAVLIPHPEWKTELDLAYIRQKILCDNEYSAKALMVRTAFEYPTKTVAELSNLSEQLQKAALVGGFVHNMHGCNVKEMFYEAAPRAITAHNDALEAAMEAIN